MKATEHIEHLLRQGHKPKELVELGFPKRVITRVRRQLREEKAAPESRAQKVTGAESRPQSAVTPLGGTTPFQPKLGPLEDKVREIEGRVEILEAISAKLEEIETRLDGTPALGLKHHFKCDCGVSGSVALHIKCTKCGRETYWGWWPEKS